MISYKDIADLFGELELHLIRSLKRNLQRHKEWEADEGFDWTAWQAEKIRNLNKYRKQNKKIAKYFLSKILPDTKQMLQEQYDEYNETDPAFFQINNRRMDALIKEMTSIEEKVTRAAVRNMDDVYRQTISKAAIGLNSGTLTLNQAIDLATKDFLNKGITCIQYKNGRMVNIASYAEMALRTNATRAQLIGMGNKMEQLGVDTVLISQYGGCSPTCLPWQGKVYINDVFMDFAGKKGTSWGISRNGKEYLLLSYAVEKGLFHPNCRHHAGIYQEGITRIPPPLDKETVNRNYALEQQQRAMERQIRWYKRLEAGTLDEVKKQAYTDQRKLAQEKLREFIKENSDVLRRDLWRERPAVEIPDSIQRKLVNAVEYDIIKKTNIVKKAIEAGEVSASVNENKQGRHIKTDKRYVDGKSYLYGDMDFARTLVTELCGTGTPIIDSKGRWTKKERVSKGIVIGVHIDPITQKETKTSKATIVYSKTGSHIIPRKEDKK